MGFHAGHKCGVNYDEPWAHDEKQAEDVEEVLGSEVRVYVIGDHQSQCDLVIADAEELPNVV